MYNQGNRSGFFSQLKNAFTYSDNNFGDSGNYTSSLIEGGGAKKESTDFRFSNNNTPVQDDTIIEKENALRTVGVTAPSYSLPHQKDLDIRFATKFIGLGGKFVFCENLKTAVDNVRMLKMENKWAHVFCWENEIKDTFNENNFQKGEIGYTIENSDAAISLCENLIAEDGTIILNPKQASRRRLHCFPKTHIIITDVAHLATNEAQGLARFSALNKGELPSVIKLGSCNNGHFYDKQRLILNSEGTEDVYVFLVDEIIPPSLRP